MILLKKIIIFCFLLILLSCAEHKRDIKNRVEKKHYASTGFALIYDDKIYEQGILKTKLKNDEIMSLHSILKRNTLIRIVNPNNSKVIETKVSKKATYPQIFNIVISKKIAEILELDSENPYVEVYELKKNKKFVAKASQTFDEEKNVALKVPVTEVDIDDLSKEKKSIDKKKIKNNNFIIFIADFYYIESAINLKNELIKQTKIKNFTIKEIKVNQFRLFAGPFKNFNSLKSTYISLNNLGFDELNIYNNLQ